MTVIQSRMAEGETLPPFPERISALPMWPHNVELIEAGKKYTTFRSVALQDNWYGLKDTAILVYLVQTPKHAIVWTDLDKFEKVEYAISEGYSTVEEFIGANRKVRGFDDFLNGKPYYRHEIKQVRRVKE